MATGGGPPTGGYGRGGRGLAILEALKKEQVGWYSFKYFQLFNTKTESAAGDPSTEVE